MALYLPAQHLAFEVVDDPCSAPVEREAFPELTVIPITCRELTNPELLEGFARALCAEREERRRKALRAASLL